MNIAASYPDHAQLLSEQASRLALFKEQLQHLINWLSAPAASAIDTRVVNYHRHDTNLESDNLAILDELASLNI